MIARSIDRCAINGSIDGAAQSIDRANPSIARNINIPCTALKASASRAGGLVDVIIFVASGALDTTLCFDRCMYYPAEHMQTDSFLSCLKIALRSTGQSLSPV